MPSEINVIGMDQHEVRVDVVVGDVLVSVILNVSEARELTEDELARVREALEDDFYRGKLSEVLQDLEVIEYVPRIIRRVNGWDFKIPIKTDRPSFPVE